MPLYEYQCKSCGFRFEKIQKFSDEPIRECPNCGRPDAEKLISAPAVQFKGEGWYVTDYARKNSTASSSTPSTDSAASASSESKTETKKESKTESKPDTKKP